VTDLHERFDPFADVEALVRSAQEYVQPSADLRPRTLEAARTERCERRVREVIWQAAIVVLMVGLFGASLRHWGDDPSAGTSHLPAAAVLTAEIATPGIDASWNMVDSFTQLRQRQAQVLRPSAKLPRPGA